MAIAKRKRLSTIGSGKIIKNSKKDDEDDILEEEEVVQPQPSKNIIQKTTTKKSSKNNENEDEEFQDNENDDDEDEKDGDLINNDIVIEEPKKKKPNNSDTTTSTTSNNNNNKQLSAKAKTKRKSIIPDTTLINKLNNNQSTIPITSTTTTSVNDIGGTISSQQLPPIPRTPSQRITSSFRSQSSQKLGDLELAQLYSNCIKLLNENKITPKNTWSLQLIDHIDNVIEQTDGELTNFQKASCTLDASIKIYSCRVDSVHSETYKVLGDLSRVDDRGGKDKSNRGDDEDDDNQEKNPNDSDAEGGSGDEKNKKGDKKKRKKSGVNTLESNLDNITTKKFDLQFMVDPLFGKTSAAFDEGGAKGLLLNQLSIYGQCKLVFDSNESLKKLEEKTQLNSSNQSCTTSTTINISSWKKLFQPDQLENLKICPTFSNFSNWSTKSKKVDESDINIDDQDSTIGAGTIDIGEGINFGDNDDSIPHHFSDNDDIDNGMNDDNNYNNNNDNDFNIQFDNNIMDFDKDDDPIDNYKENTENQMQTTTNIIEEDWKEYNFFEPNLTQNWAGPEHWKFGKRKSPTLDSENNQDTINNSTTKKKQKTKKKGAFLLDFDAPPPPDSMFEPPKGKTTTTLSSAALKKASETSTLLPEDNHYDIKMLSRLFNKPSCIIPPMSKRGKKNISNDDLPSSQCLNDASQDVSGSIGDIGGFNDDDDDNNIGFDNDYGDTNYFGNGGDKEEISTISATINTTNDVNEEIISADGFVIGINNGSLVKEPVKVAKTDINYDKVPVKIDVKSLKSSVWNIIESDFETPPTTEQQPPSSPIIDEEEEIPPPQEKEKNTFSNIVDNLKRKQNRDISVALTFIC
eukprot:gene11102-13583_t